MQSAVGSARVRHPLRVYFKAVTPRRPAHEPVNPHGRLPSGLMGFGHLISATVALETDARQATWVCSGGEARPPSWHGSAANGHGAACGQ